MSFLQPPSFSLPHIHTHTHGGSGRRVVMGIEAPVLVPMRLTVPLVDDRLVLLSYIVCV